MSLRPHHIGVAGLLLVGASTVAAQTGTAETTYGEFFPVLTLLAVTIGFFVAMLWSVRILSKPGQHWNLGEALSEKSGTVVAEATRSTSTPASIPADAMTIDTPPSKDLATMPVVTETTTAVAAAGAAASGPSMVASTSRLIAFLGTIGILCFYMGLGFYVLWALFNGKVTEAADAAKAVGPYMLYGSALYAPYAFNQIKDAFK